VPNAPSVRAPAISNYGALPTKDILVLQTVRGTAVVCPARRDDLKNFRGGSRAGQADGCVFM